MRKKLTLVLILSATVALAHGGVQNPAVMARMEAMKQIGDGMKVLGPMAKGEATFNATSAQAALALIATQSAQVPALFKAPETDPKTEALPAIWLDWADFDSKAQDMIRASEGSVSDPAALRDTVSALAGSCKACHRIYREKD